ncbi:MAG: TIGR04295 family B12-binding domain-containing radical SAM protein [Terriglobales bacterium]
MKFALIQPQWSFAGSTYFGCTETHLPLELLYARQQLEAAGHETLLLDAHLAGMDLAQAAAAVRAFAPDFTVVTTAPTYLFWRCPQPELRVPAAWMRALRLAAPRAVQVAIGPHGSATPAAAAAKLGADTVIVGEADQVLAQLASHPWSQVPGCFVAGAAPPRLPPAQADLQALGPLDYSRYPLHRRQHQHHVFSGTGRGAEVEFSRGCPWACTFCNKTLFRNRFRERAVSALLTEVETLAQHGIGYVYFIDEIFGCSRQTAELLDGLAQLPVRFGMQTRIDLWQESSLEQLGRAGCISMECGIESVTPEGRDRFRKGCSLSTDRIQQLLLTARRAVPWVQANLIADEQDDLDAIERWRRQLVEAGVWVSQPVPVYPFPGTPLYQKLFGAPDDQAWERAHARYLQVKEGRGYLSDLQDPLPQPLAALER